MISILTSLRVNDLPPPPNGLSGWPWTEGITQSRDMMPDSRVCPKISIVTPSLNQSCYLEETIRSVLLQGYPNLEYIIIDGGSTDNSVDIIKKYEPWLKYWVSEPDHGQAAAINKGFKAATGSILAWINSDDVYLKGAFHKIATFFQINRDVHLVYGGCKMISSDGTFLVAEKALPFNPSKLLMHNIIAQPSTFFTKTFFASAGPLDEDIRFCFDLELWLKGSFLFHYRHYPGVLSNFRYHQGSKTLSNTLSMAKEATEVTISFLEKQSENNDSLTKSIRLRYLNLAVWQWKLDRQDSSNISKYLRRADISEDLFDIGSIPHILRPFLALKHFQFRNISQDIADIKEFYIEYLQPHFHRYPKRYLTSMISHAYLKISLKTKNPFFLYRAVLCSPKYIAQLSFFHFRRFLTNLVL